MKEILLILSFLIFGLPIVIIIISIYLSCWLLYNLFVLLTDLFSYIFSSETFVLLIIILLLYWGFQDEIHTIIENCFEKLSQIGSR